MRVVKKVRPHPGSLSLGLQIAQSKYFLQTLDSKVATICILGAVGYGSKRPPTEADPQTPAFLKEYVLHPRPEPLVLYLNPYTLNANVINRRIHLEHHET